MQTFSHVMTVFSNVITLLKKMLEKLFTSENKQGNTEIKQSPSSEQRGGKNNTINYIINNNIYPAQQLKALELDVDNNLIDQGTYIHTGGFITESVWNKRF